MSDSDDDSESWQSSSELLADELYECCRDGLSEECIREIIERHELTHHHDNAVSDYQFFLAACCNEKTTEEIIQYLLEYFPDAVNSADGEGQLPLTYACNSNDVPLGVIQLLIDAAPDSVHHKDNGGNTPLHILCADTALEEARALEILQLLLERCPESVRLANNIGYLPIHIAAMVSKSTDLCRLLIEAYPGSERMANHPGNHAGNHAGTLPLHCACTRNSIAMVKYFYNLYPDAIEHATAGGLYPIHAVLVSATVNHENYLDAVDVVKFLLGCNPNVKFQELEGQSLLVWVCLQEYNDANIGAVIEMIRVIYDAHPEFIREEDSQGDLPLHCLCKSKLDGKVVVAILKLLLEKYPESIRHANNKGFLPIHTAAATTTSPEFLSVLIKAYPGSERMAGPMDMLPLHFACTYNSVTAIEYLYNLYPDAIHIEASGVMYPIYIATGGLRVDVVKFLLGCNPHVKFQELEGQSLLVWVCLLPQYRGDTKIGEAVEIIELILDAHPELIRKEDSRGDLPLHCLCRSKVGVVAILKLLLRKYPESIRHANHEGSLPIHLALPVSKSPDFCRLLIEAYPGSESVVNHLGMLPIHLACLGKNVATLDYLYKLYPDAIDRTTNQGLYPIHIAITRAIQIEGSDQEASVDIVKFLLGCDLRVKYQKFDGDISLLALVCNQDYNDTKIGTALKLIEALYDADPQEIEDSEIVMNIDSFHPGLQAFMTKELSYSYLSKDRYLMTTPDGNGQLPLHNALLRNVRLGSIKLLVRGYPTAVQYPNNSGALPLHVACMHHESASVVQYLVELDTTALEAVDEGNDTALHYACRSAKFETIALLLRKYGAISVSKRNAQKKLPIDLLWESSEVVDRESVEYTGSIFQLVKAYPETVMNWM